MAVQVAVRVGLRCRARACTSYMIGWTARPRSVDEAAACVSGVYPASAGDENVQSYINEARPDKLAVSVKAALVFFL